jgi:hypothetical protein
MYDTPDDQTPGDHGTMEEDDDELGVRRALARFAARWDECEQDARRDEGGG